MESDVAATPSSATSAARSVLQSCHPLPS